MPHAVRYPDKKIMKKRKGNRILLGEHAQGNSFGMKLGESFNDNNKL